MNHCSAAACWLPGFALGPHVYRYRYNIGPWHVCVDVFEFLILWLGYCFVFHTWKLIEFSKMFWVACNSRLVQAMLMQFVSW